MTLVTVTFIAFVVAQIADFFAVAANNYRVYRNV